MYNLTVINQHCVLFSFTRDFLNGIYRPFLHHEIFTNDDVRAKVQQIESLGDTWIYVFITVIINIPVGCFFFSN